MVGVEMSQEPGPAIGIILDLPSKSVYNKTSARNPLPWRHLPILPAPNARSRRIDIA